MLSQYRSSLLMIGYSQWATVEDKRIISQGFFDKFSTVDNGATLHQTSVILCAFREGLATHGFHR
ncbi:hypothetical protein [Vibrio metschnikovii]|uniref:hypothetical protein n=1 Tax=Vibrio metschnikovii TaxID=28172 RepID=UPI001C30E49E|nr:hypothetical protein [Vibrio metschnikovii]